MIAVSARAPTAHRGSSTPAGSADKLRARSAGVRYGLPTGARRGFFRPAVASTQPDSSRMCAVRAVAASTAAVRRARLLGARARGQPNERGCGRVSARVRRAA